MGGFDTELFDAFIGMRLGTGDPIYWYFIGDVRSYPDGKPVAVLESVDTGRLFRPPEEPEAPRQLSRKLFVFRHPETQDVLWESGGNPVRHVVFPYQHLTYRLEGDEIAIDVEQGMGEHRQRIGPITEMTARRLAAGLMVFTAPMFLPMPGFELYEHYDFFLDPGASSAGSISWIRYCDLPSFAGKGRSIMHLTAQRYDRFGDLPDGIGRFISENAPAWQEPPLDMDEIGRIQEGDFEIPEGFAVGFGGK
jgi:hypothetical protein